MPNSIRVEACCYGSRVQPRFNVRVGDTVLIRTKDGLHQATVTSLPASDRLKVEIIDASQEHEIELSAASVVALMLEA
jgi:hypothetical protein